MVLYDHGCGSSNVGMTEPLPLLELYETTISWMCPTLKWHGVSRVEMLMRGAWRQRRCNINPWFPVDQGRQLELLKFQDREVRSENQCSQLWRGGYSQEWQCRAYAWRPGGLQIHHWKLDCTNDVEQGNADPMPPNDDTGWICPSACNPHLRGKKDEEAWNLELTLYRNYWGNPEVIKFI